MTVYTITGTNADETISPSFSTPSVTSTGPDNHSTGTADIIYAGGGDDHVAAGGGDDEVHLGAGNDIFDWANYANPGGGSDDVDGGAGTDTFNFKGFGEAITLERGAGSTAELHSDGNTITLSKIEKVVISGDNGDDRIHIENLSGTGIKSVIVDLASGPGQETSDGATDMVDIHGANGADDVRVLGPADAIRFVGLPATVTVTHADSYDSIAVLLGGGADHLDASRSKIGLQIGGDDGNDTLLGGKHTDTIYGGKGKDFLSGGAGVDVLRGADFYAADEYHDVMRGGKGADFFWLELQTNGAKADSILDFKPGLDKIVLYFEELGVALNGGDFDGAVNFVVGKQAADGNDFIIYDPSSGRLWFDGDGSGNGQDMQMLGFLGKHLALTGSDIEPAAIIV